MKVSEGGCWSIEACKSLSGGTLSTDPRLHCGGTGGFTALDVSQKVLNF